MRPTAGCDKVGNPRTFALKLGETLPARYADAPPPGTHLNDPTHGQPRPSEAAGAKKGRRRRGGWRQRRAEEKMIEGAWILVIAGVVFAAIVAVVLLGSGKLYDPDRSHE